MSIAPPTIVIPMMPKIPAKKTPKQPLPSSEKSMKKINPTIKQVSNKPIKEIIEQN